MTVLLLKLAAPLQSWGSSSRFVRRGTESAPTKSGVIGLLAAAGGRRRTEPIEDLAALTFGVRIDQPGRLVRDFQTEVRADGTRLPLSYRFYLADAVFLAAVEGDDALVEGLADAIRRPVFPLFLGRRSCPPAGPLLPQVLPGSVDDVLRAQPWAASRWYRRKREVADLAEVPLELMLDCRDGEPADMTFRDAPISFDSDLRRYGWRRVRYDRVVVPGPAADRPNAAAAPGRAGHDPFGAL